MRLRLCKLIALAALIAVAACTEQNYYSTQLAPDDDAAVDGSSGDPNDSAANGGPDSGDELPPADDAGPGREAGASNGQMDSGLPEPTGPSTIRMTAPVASVSRVTGTVSLQMAVEGDPVERVDVWIDGSLMASLPLPYQLEWNTTQASEGAHTIVARAVRDGIAVSETTRELTVDRTRPELVRMIPESGTKALSLDAPLVLVFSEAIAADSIMDTISVDVAGKPQAFTAVLQADPSRVELRLAKPAPLLPATATLTLSSGIRDLAGSPLRKGTPLTAAFPAWRELGPPLKGAGGITNFESDGKVIWALLQSYDNFAKVTVLTAAHWDQITNSWLTHPITSAPLDVSRSLLTIASNGLPIVYFEARQGEAPTQYMLKRRETDGRWTDLTLPSDYGAPSQVSYLGTEPSGSLVLAPSYSSATKVYRLRGGVWQTIGAQLPTPGLMSVSVSELGLAVAYGTSPCLVQREGPTGWVDMGSVQSGGGCSDVSLFARPGSRLGAFVHHSVTSGNNTTHSYAVFEHSSGTKWLPPSFGVPALARSALRSQNDLLFVAPSESTVYDRLAEPMVREFPVNPSPFGQLGKMAVWEGAPVMAQVQISGGLFPFPMPAPGSELVQMFELNHIK